MRLIAFFVLAALAVVVSGCDRNPQPNVALESRIADLERQVSDLQNKLEDLEKFIGPRTWYQSASLPEALRSLQYRIEDVHREIGTARRQK